MVNDVVRAWSVGSVVLAGLLLCCVPAHAANTTPAEAGKMYYRQYCASCHGAGGKGDGPMAPALKAKTPDLTQLAKTHGGKEMPAWGETFQSDVDGDAMQQAAIRGRLMLLTDYIRSIQEK